MRVLQIPYRSAVADISDKGSFTSSKPPRAHKPGVWGDFGFLCGFPTVNRRNFSAPRVSERSSLGKLAELSLQARGMKDAL